MNRFQPTADALAETSSDGEAEHADGLVRFVRAVADLALEVGHGERLSVLVATAAAPSPGLSPVAYSRTSACSIGAVAYHFRTLLKAGLLVESGTSRRRGAIVHFYKLTERGQALVDRLKALRTSSPAQSNASGSGAGTA